MAGFPLMNIGTGLTGFMGGFQQAQQAAQQRQMNQILMAMRQRALEQDQQQEQARANAFTALLGLQDQQPIQQTMVPPMPGQGSVPGGPTQLPGGAPAKPISSVADTGFDPTPSASALAPPPVAPAPDAMGEGTMEGLPPLPQPNAMGEGTMAGLPAAPPAPAQQFPLWQRDQYGAPKTKPFYQSDPGYMGLGADIAPAAPAQPQLSGGRYSYDQLRGFAQQAGFQGPKADLMAAISMAESQGDPNAVAVNDGGTGYNSYGVTQILGVHPGAAEAKGNPLRAMELAYKVSDGGTNFRPWTMFKNGQYQKYLGGGGEARTGGGGDTLAAGGGPRYSVGMRSDEGQGDFGSQLPPEQQSRRTAISVMSQAPGAAWGSTRIQTLAQAIERANPGASPAVKFMALQEASKLLTPDDKTQLQMFMLENKQQFQVEMERMREEFRAQNKNPPQGQVFIDPETKRPYSIVGSKATPIEGIDQVERPGGAAGVRQQASRNIEVTDAEGKVIFKGAAHKGPDGEWVSDKDRKPVEVPDDGSIRLAGAAGPGRQAATAINRLTIAGNEIPKALNNLVDLPISATSGIFGGIQAERPADLGDAVKRSLANKLTSEDAQSVLVSFQGISRSIAAIEAAGAATGLVGLTARADVLMPREGDTSLTVLRKYAEIRQLMEQGLDAVKAMPDVSPQQVKKIDEMLRDVKQAVPWTVSDVNKLQRNPDAKTVKEFARDVGASSEAGAPAAVPSEAVADLKSNPTPERKTQFDAIFGPGAADRALGNR